MIEEVAIQNYALIDRLTIRFEKGMTVLSGETGAGKSILAGALGLLHGERADVSSIRTGCQEAMVAGVFSVAEASPVGDWLRERDLSLDEGRLYVRRTIKTTGRGSIYVQSAPVPLKDLAQLGAMLFDMHGQHEHQSLFIEENHRSILDSWGRLDEMVQEYSSKFAELARLRRKRNAIVSDEQARQREMEILTFAVQEIEAAKLLPGEDGELLAEKTMLSQYEKLHGNMVTVVDSLAESHGGALRSLRQARTALESTAAIDSQLNEYVRRLEDSFFELEDIAESLSGYQQRMLFDPQRLEKVEDRLADIRRLQKKYGASIEDVLGYAAEASETLHTLENSEEEKEKLDIQIRETEKDVLSRARIISAQRKEKAVALGGRIEKVSATLGMPKVSFEIAVDSRLSESGKPVCGTTGQDSVFFRISANPGEPAKPLSSVASGGEVSRLMLAIKSVLAETDPIETLIFDEIDTGIGGEVALSVGQHLQELAASKQVFCITHLASVAVRADNHLVVYKEQKDERTVTRVEGISQQERVEEIARMLAGDGGAEVSRNHAEELLRKYRANN
ncbi:MAG: DNA repair protein RecN [Spirochaetaceae bacterium]|nr:MAG: DNA repair protein RecN [Spirochaetaceae bacterium]